MKRFNSDPYNQKAHKDNQSSILGGNLSAAFRNVESLSTSSDEEDFIEEEHSTENESFKSGFGEEFYQTATEEEVKKADRILYDIFGVNIISVFTKLLLQGQILPRDFVCQGLAYKCQSLIRGLTGVRYEKSWGIFWAACRNLIKTRGLISFRDHFSIPSVSQLVKYKKDAIKMCGLEESSLGKSGLQTKSTELWINSKSTECEGSTLALSVSMDGKKISVTKEGTEDMGGIADFATKDAEAEAFETDLKNMIALLKQNDRNSLFTLFDNLSYSSQEIINKLSGLKILEGTNLKRLDKNPNLSKYIHVLREQLDVGRKLMNKVCDVQCNVVQLIAEKRKSGHLLPKSQVPDIHALKNYERLTEQTASQDRSNLLQIEHSLKSESLFDVPWSFLKLKIGNMSRLSRESTTFRRLFELCYLSSDQMFLACGLGTSRPVQDMKTIYLQSHSYPSTLTPPDASDRAVIGSLCAVMAPMTFGTNCQIVESGIHIKDGICSIPDQLIVTSEGKIEFTTKTCTGRMNIFDVEYETLAQCVVDSYICGSKKGSLVLQYNELSLVVINVPADAGLAEDLISFSDSYLTANRCLSKRSKDMISKQDQLRTALSVLKESIKILGSYPLFDHFNSQGLTAPCSASGSKIEMKMKELMQEKKMFLAKQARELVAVNLSDMSGNPSSTPHTTLAATFLSSGSLKVVGEKCVNEVIRMVEERNCKCLNIGVDGESLQFAIRLPNGTPGTELSLAKSALKKLQSFSKDSLVKLISKNHLIELDDIQTNDEESEGIEEQLMEEELIADLEDSLAIVQQFDDPDGNFSLEDIEEMLSCGAASVNKVKEQEIRQNTVTKLRLICLKHILPRLKKNWLVKNIGQEKLTVFFQDGEQVDYSPCNVFHKSSNGLFRTITFDYAHLINLYRESAAKGKLLDMGLSSDNLTKLSKREGFEYLLKIIALKNGKLKFDSMNQQAAAALFSDKTVSGLKLLKDYTGAKCVELVSRGLSAFDESGRSSEDRVRSLICFKNFMVDKNNIFDRLKRPNDSNITNELYMMTLCSIDSHLFTFLNLEFFNPRRKSTGTVEMLFGQLMLLTEGCTKLNVRQLQDVLQRVTLSNALRLLPSKVRGFQFLGQLKMHMKSYHPDDVEAMGNQRSYPKIKLSNGSLHLLDSSFDKPTNRKKRKFKDFARSSLESSSSVRKFHEKF